MQSQMDWKGWIGRDFGKFSGSVYFGYILRRNQLWNEDVCDMAGVSAGT